MHFLKPFFAPNFLILLFVISFFTFFASCKPGEEDIRPASWEGTFEGRYAYSYYEEDGDFDETTMTFIDVNRSETKDIVITIRVENEDQLLVSGEMSYTFDTSGMDLVGACYKDQYFEGYSSREEEICLLNNGDRISIELETNGKESVHGGLKRTVSFLGERVE